MTTVGYGDVYPKTDAGRVTICITAIVGLVLISLYVAALNSAVMFNKHEFHSYIEIKRSKNQKAVENHASNVIKAAVKLKKAKNGKTVKKIFIE